MNLNNLLNEHILSSLISEEVEKLAEIKFKEFRKELLENYTFDDKLLSREATAKKLDISVRQVDNLVKKGRLNKCSIGRSVKIKNSIILAYISSIK